ncbi:hypothetical protein EV363DRAFT_1456577 [Boletus edulis]|nr:hypothetical protein EV363DRAFT_1456577 [Boletus edulis]
MTLFSMEVFVPSRGDRMPDANQDEIVAFFYPLSPQLNPHRLRDYSLEVLSDEVDLINRIIDVDPDILLG